MPKKTHETEEMEFMHTVAIQAATKITEEEDLETIIRSAVEEKVRESIDTDAITAQVKEEISERLDDLDMDEITEKAVKMAVDNSLSQIAEEVE